MGERAQDFSKQEFFLVWSEHFNKLDLLVTVFYFWGPIDPVEEKVLFLLVVGVIDEKLPKHFDVFDSYLDVCVTD